MKTQDVALKAFACTFFLSALLSCSSHSDHSKKAQSDSSATSTTAEITGVVPDSIIQFLITSAANDFHNHQPPTAMDFRKVTVGYVLLSPQEKNFVLCGEFLSQEKKKEWETFATVKTVDYEHYLGSQALPFCQGATVVLSDEMDLSVELKNKLLALRKQQ